MAAAASSSWMPSTGRYPVNIGSSLGRALKARKGAVAPKSKIPDRDFYSFRYNFKPESVDSTKPGTIDVKRGKDNTSVTVERASTQTGEGGHVFIGSEHPAKEWECVLIYDEELGTFSLEKLDSYVNLTYDRKTTQGPRHPGSPLPPPRPSTSTTIPSATVSSTNKVYHTSAVEELEAELERDLLGMDVDAEGEPDDESGEVIPIEVTPTTPLSAKKEPILKEKGVSNGKTKGSNARASKATRTAKIIPPRKEEEDSEREVALAKSTSSRTISGKSKVSSTTKPKIMSTPKPATKPAPAVPHPLPPKPRPSQPQAPPSAAPIPAGRPTAKAPVGTKRERAIGVEDDTIEFGQFSQPPKKRPRPSSPIALPSKTKGKAESFSLALPNGSGISLPGSSSTSVSLPSATHSAPSPIPQPAPASLSDSEDESQWVPIMQSPPIAPASVVPRAIEMEEIVPTASRRQEESDPAESSEEEIDMNAFEEEMNQHLGGDEEEEDFPAAAVSPEIPSAGRPMSLNQLAQANGDGGDGDNIWGDEYDSSSSEDSDDD